MLCTEGKDHQMQRRRLHPPLAGLNLQSYFEIFHRMGQNFLDELSTTVSSCPDVDFNLHEFHLKVTLSMLGISIFGHDFSGREQSVISKAYHELLQPLEMLDIILSRISTGKMSA